MPLKIEQFCRETGQPPPTTRGEFVRACLDSLALTYRRTLEGLEDVLGRKIGVIHIVGGGCQNELLNQMTADACNRPVVAGPIEATAIGNILVQAMATGDVKSLADARAIVRESFEVKRYEPREIGKQMGRGLRAIRRFSVGRVDPRGLECRSRNGHDHRLPRPHLRHHARAREHVAAAAEEHAVSVHALEVWDSWQKPAERASKRSWRDNARRRSTELDAAVVLAFDAVYDRTAGSTPPTRTCTSPTIT